MNFKEKDIMSTEDKFLKKYNNIFITQEQIDILKKYKISIENYKNFDELMFDIEDCLNNSYGDLEDLEYVSSNLSEFNYYNNINK